MAVAATLLALLPVFVLLVTRAGRGYLPHGDIAFIDLRVRDVFSGDVPLLGPYSRYAWNHPGPLFFYLLAPLNALAGGAAWSTLIGAALLQAIAVAASARLAWQRGRLPLVLLVLAAVSLAMHAVGPRLLLDAWNPNVTLPFFALFVLLVWSVSLGDRWHLVGATIVGSFLVQSHAGYAPLVGAGAAYAVVIVFVDERRRRSTTWRRWTRPALVAVGVAALAWLPTLIDELTSDPGNLTRLARYVRDSTDSGVGLSDGAGLLAAEFRIVPPWLGGNNLVEPLTGAALPASVWWLLIPTVLLLGGAVVARRRSVGGAGRLLGLVAVLSVVGVAALANVEPPTNDYLFRWRGLLAPLVVAAAVWALLDARALGDRLRFVVPGILVALLGYGAVAQAWDVGDHSGPVNGFESTTRSLLRQLAPDEIPDRPFLARNPSLAYRGIYAAVVDELDRRGRPIRLDPVFDFVVGEHRTAALEDVDTVWYVAEEGRDVSLLTARPGARVLARTTPLTRAQERELVDLQRSLARDLEAAGRSDLVVLLEYRLLVQELAKVPGLDRDAIDRVDELNALAARSGRSRAAIIAFPTDGPLPRQDWEPRR